MDLSDPYNLRGRQQWSADKIQFIFKKLIIRLLLVDHVLMFSNRQGAPWLVALFHVQGLLSKFGTLSIKQLFYFFRRM
jgi:hypothetical protein